MHRKKMIDYSFYLNEECQHFRTSCEKILSPIAMVANSRWMLKIDSSSSLTYKILTLIFFPVK